MATTTFQGYSVVNIGTTATNVYTVSALKALLISVIIANKSTNSTFATVEITRGATTSTLIKSAPLPAGSSLEIIDNKPVVLNQGDILKVTADNSNTVDVILSVAEQN